MRDMCWIFLAIAWFPFLSTGKSLPKIIETTTQDTPYPNTQNTVMGTIKATQVTKKELNALPGKKIDSLTNGGVRKNDTEPIMLIPRTTLISMAGRLDYIKCF